MKTIDISHGGHSGDIVYGLATGRQLCLNNGADMANLFIASDRPANLAPGMRHPNGPNIMMSRHAFDFIAPLLEIQPWIAKIQFVPDARIPGSAYRLDPYRIAQGINTTAGSIADFPGKIYGIHVDTSAPWISVKPVKPSEFLLTLCFSRRYRNTSIDYSFLERFPQARFVGLPDEYEDFVRRNRLTKLTYLPCANALEMAEAIQSSRVFLGNQSFAFAIAEALKVRRALEVCELVPNVVPTGAGCGSFIYQTGLINLLKGWGLALDDLNAESRPANYTLFWDD